MDLFAFTRAPDPTKVRVVEWERDDDEPRLLETIVGCTILLLPVTPDRADSELEASVDRVFDEGGSGHHTKQGDSTRGGQDVNIQPVVEAADTIVEGAAPVRSRRLGKRKYVVVDLGGFPSSQKAKGESWNPEFVISSDSSHHSETNVAEAEIDSLIRSSAPIMTTVTTITLTVDHTFVTKEKVVEPTLFGVGSSSTGGTDPIACVFSDLTGSDFLIGDIRTVINPDTNLQKTYFYVRAAQQMSLSDGVRIRVEYNIKEKKRLKCVVDEQEAAEAIRLRAQASELETAERSLRDEANALKERNFILEKERDFLDVKVAELKLQLQARNVHELEVSSSGLQEKVTVYENYIEQLEKFQDDRMKIINDKFDKLYTDFVEMALHLEEKFYPHLLTTIFGRMWLLTHGLELAIVKCLNSPEYLSALGTAIGKAIKKGMQDGLAAGITHGKEGRVLMDVYVYNPSAKADYIFALQQLQNVNFLLLAELRSNKDSSIEAIIEILHLENSVAEKLGLNEIQPNVGQLMVPIHYSPDQVVDSATALSLALDTSSSRVQKIRDNIANQRSVLRDVFVLLAEPFFSIVLMGSEVAPDVVLATATTTTLSTILASTSAVDPISINNYEVVDADDQAVARENFASFPNVDYAELRIPH
nr:hypothetical protein [Tanacetum cinerariifolium]